MGGVLKSWAWLVPLAFAAVLGGLGWTTYLAVERDIKAGLSEELTTLLRADAAALEMWMRQNQDVASSHAADRDIAETTTRLAGLARRAEDPVAALQAATDEDARLRAILEPVLASHGYTDYWVIVIDGRILAAANETHIGAIPPQNHASLMDYLRRGEATIRPPRELVGVEGGATILAAAPILAGDGKPQAGLIFAIPPNLDFSRILGVARMGESGETYGFDAEGMMLSESRFEQQLRDLGLIDPDDPNATSVLTIPVRDPGGDMTQGFVPELPPKARPYTRMAASAVSGESGFDVDGYRDYRGVPVIGAWTWLDDLDMGLTTEIDVAEAFAGLDSLKRRFGLLIGLLVIAALGLLFYSVVVVRLRSKVSEVQRLGRYHLQEKIGAGGMGSVYRASHQMLRRPTAIKLMKQQQESEAAAARFEREVQVASSLSHPNTILIYDYGRTPTGVFYYAMEYIEGITLGDCVEMDGAQPEARVVALMRQVCGSLAEAHAAGLVHRDLKPANIMLSERGGISDFVKVLDFGLVREQDQADDLALTQDQSLTGTPLYMPPEVIQSPKAVSVASDVYQLGGIAYYLLVGRHLFRGENAIEVLSQHVKSAPQPPSEALGVPVSDDLEGLILRCLAKDPADRFADAGEMLEALERCTVSGEWTQAQARDWWQLWHQRHPAGVQRDLSSSGSMASEFSIDLGAREAR